MKKWQKVLLFTAISVGVIGIAGKVAFDYAADKFVKKMATTMEKDPQVQKILQDKNVQKKLDQLKSNPNLQQQLQKSAGQLQRGIASAAANGSLKDGTSNSSSKNAPSSVSAADKANNHSDTSSNPDSQPSGHSSSGGLHFSSTSEAASYAMKRFSLSEINYYRGLVNGGLTPAKKKEIKAVVLSRFSPEEIRALIEAAQK